MAFPGKVCMIFLEPIIIGGFDFPSFATWLYTVSRSCRRLYSQIPRIDFWMSAMRTEAVILGWAAP